MVDESQDIQQPQEQPQQQEQPEVLQARHKSIEIHVQEADTPPIDK